MTAMSVFDGSRSKIDDPEFLIEVAGAEPDEDLRRDAVDKAAELMLAAVPHADGAGEAAAALAKAEKRRCDAR